MTNLRQRVRIKVIRAVLAILVRSTGRGERLGSGYGGWWLPDDCRLDLNSICYLVGVGEDITFDLALLNRFSPQVHSFDPTPRAIDFIAGQELPMGFHFHPYGIGGTNRRAKFFAPENPTHVSHSITNLQGTDTFFEAELRTLSSVARELGHGRIDMVKLDIEGAEYEVLESMLDNKVFPYLLLVEFDDPKQIRRTLRTIRALRRVGYVAYHVEGFNVMMRRLSSDFPSGLPA